jgi:hypothetical protein
MALATTGPEITGRRQQEQGEGIDLRTGVEYSAGGVFFVPTVA